MSLITYGAAGNLEVVSTLVKTSGRSRTENQLCARRHSPSIFVNHEIAFRAFEEEFGALGLN